MHVERGKVLAVFCSIVVLAIHFCGFSPHLPMIAQGQSLSFVGYYIDSVFVGNLTHIIQIYNQKSNTISDGQLLVPLIRNETARHFVICNISSSSGKPTFAGDESGSIYALWTDIVIDRNQIFRVEIVYQILSFGTEYSVDSNLAADYNRSSYLYRKYTQPEQLIESDNPEIVSTAQAIVNNENDKHKKVFKIYSFVTTHLSYVVQDDEKGALWALKNGVGDCSEYSYLFVALCRAIQIPARIQAGFAFHSDRETLEDGHMWAEYYLENYGWIPVDAAWYLFDKMDYRHFGSIQSTPELMSYGNFVFSNTAVAQSEEMQIVTLNPCAASLFPDEIFAEKSISAVQKINEARFALSFANFLGISVIFGHKQTKLGTPFRTACFTCVTLLSSGRLNRSLPY